MPRPERFPRLSRSSTTYLLATCLIGGVGCDTPPDATESNEGALRPVTPPSGGASGVSKGIKGTLLYEKSLGNKHAVQFYEFPHGGVGVRESLSADGGQKSFLDGSGTVSSLGEVFRRLNPGAAVPTALVDADRRFAARERLRGGLPAGAPKTTAPSGEKSPVQSLSAGGQGSCSADNYGDGWGGDWFINTRCTQGNFRWCQKNFGWAYSGEWQSSNWASWRQMEGDFNVNGHIRGTIIDCHWYGCDPRTDLFDYDVLPRRIEVWNFGGTDDIYGVRGDSPCGHLHVAFLRN